MKVLITGVSGTGKSTISKALNERGILSFDFSDVSGLSFWRNIETKETAEYPSTPTETWFAEHERICDIAKLTEILAEHESIVITGVASGNQTEYLPLFDKVILLQCAPETFTHRMQTRVPEWGKTKVAQDNVTLWQKDFDPIMLSLGAVPVNTEGSFDEVLAAIISQIT